MASKTSAHRNEVNYNTVLPSVLSSRLRGWDLDAERSGTVKDSRRVPDAVASSVRVMPVWIEGKYDSSASKAAEAEQQASTAVGQKFAKGVAKGKDVDFAVAVLYPAEIAHDTDLPESVLEKATVKFASFSKGALDALVRFPESGWENGDMDDLADFLEVVADSQVSPLALKAAFTDAVNDGASILNKQFPNMAETVMQENCEQTDQMVSALLLNALIFQHIIAIHHKGRIDSPTQMKISGNILPSDIAGMWKQILDINYYPIFGIALKCLTEISVDTTKAKQLVETLLDASEQISAVDPHAAQLLAGDAFGSLIADRKFLASFYTLPESAYLLSELALGYFDADWSNADEVTGLKIADFACGTGVLLATTYKRIQTKCRRKGLDTTLLHQQMIEDVFVGADIMPASVHITAATLSAMHPEIDYTKTETHVMPYGDFTKEFNVKDDGKEGIRVGSLELLQQSAARSLFGDGSSAVQSKGEKTGSEIEAPDRTFDLVIMNPPYTKPTNHKTKARSETSHPNYAAFGADKPLQKQLADREKRIFNTYKRQIGHTKETPKVAKHGNAPGAPFFDLAHAKVKVGGILALVLSASMPTGKAWESTREILANEYENVTIIGISAGKSLTTNFSSETSIAEVLVIAKKREAPEKQMEHLKSDYPDTTNQQSSIDIPWIWVSLEKRPESQVAAAIIARRVLNAPKKTGITSIKIGNTDYGIIAVGDRKLALQQIQSRELIETAVHLFDPMNHRIEIPRTGDIVPLPLCKLGELGTRGYLDRDIGWSKHDPKRAPFLLEPYEKGKSRFPILWSHEGSPEDSLILPIDYQGRIFSGSDPVTNEKMKSKAAERWGKASRLHFNRDFNLNSCSMSACMTDPESIGGRAWPNFKIHLPGSDEEHLPYVYPVLLWANCTLGLISFYCASTLNMHRRASITISRLPDLLVLDPRQLSEIQLDKAEKIFNKFKEKIFKSANQACEDNIRKELDRAVLHEILNLNNDVIEEIELLRSHWCSEPHVT